jgi:hypothetical protein
MWALTTDTLPPRDQLVLVGAFDRLGEWRTGVAQWTGMRWLFHIDDNYFDEEVEAEYAPQYWHPWPAAPEVV